MRDAQVESVDVDCDGERRWEAELRLRIAAFRAGEMKAIPLEEALAEAERLLEAGG